MKYIYYTCFLLSLSFFALGEVGCGRVATVNQKTVLVDSGSRLKGEGLRYYLKKDPQALKLLNQYQEGQEVNWFRSGLSMTGTALALGGLLLADSEDSGFFQRDTLLYSGSLMILIGYILTKTHNHSNEKLFYRSIEEYNKKNEPQIYFAPIYENRQSGYNIGLQLKIATY